MSQLALVRRIAARHRGQLALKRTAVLQIGNDSFNGSILVHRYRDALSVKDLTHAGKRGKKIPTVSVTPTWSVGGMEERTTWLRDVGEELVKCDTWAKVTAYLQRLKTVDEEGTDLFFRDERGIDTAPYGPRIRLETKTGLEITAEPKQMSVRYTFYFDPRAPEAKPGDIVDPARSRGTAHDTYYHADYKEGAPIFYAWLKDNLTRVDRMQIDELRSIMTNLGVKYSSH